MGTRLDRCRLQFQFTGRFRAQDDSRRAHAVYERKEQVIAPEMGAFFRSMYAGAQRDQNSLHPAQDPPAPAFHGTVCLVI